MNLQHIQANPSISLRKIPTFVDEIISGLSKLNINVQDFYLDHVCYRVETEQEYITCYNELNQVATLLIEQLIGGRPIATFKLHEPILVSKYNRQVSVIELPMPKSNTFYSSGFEHCEFVITQNLKDFADLHNVKWDFSGLNKKINSDIRIKFNDSLGKVISVKFHNDTLENFIKCQLLK